MSAKATQKAENAGESAGEWKCVDDRPFECPNGHGILETESSTSVWCPDCGYSRVVIKYVEDSE